MAQIPLPGCASTASVLWFTVRVSAPGCARQPGGRADQHTAQASTSFEIFASSSLLVVHALVACERRPRSIDRWWPERAPCFRQVCVPAVTGVTHDGTSPQQQRVLVDLDPAPALELGQQILDAEPRLGLARDVEARSAPRAASAAGRRGSAPAACEWVTISVVRRSSRHQPRRQLQHELGRARVERRRVLVEQQDLGRRHASPSAAPPPAAARPRAAPSGRRAGPPARGRASPAARASAPGRPRPPPAPAPCARPRASASARFSSIVSVGAGAGRAGPGTPGPAAAPAAAAPCAVTSVPSTAIRPAVAAHRAGQHVEQGRLAGAVAADHGDELALAGWRGRCRAAPGSPAPCPAGR